MVGKRYQGTPHGECGELSFTGFGHDDPGRRVFDVTGQPSVSLPLAHSSDGLPISIHLVGRFGDEGTLVRVERNIKEARPWKHHRPDLQAGKSGLSAGKYQIVHLPVERSISCPRKPQNRAEQKAGSQCRTLIDQSHDCGYPVQPQSGRQPAFGDRVGDHQLSEPPRGAAYSHAHGVDISYSCKLCTICNKQPVFPSRPLPSLRPGILHSHN
ncbi:hypothetical protein DPM33_30410 [Mesorhizobium hawassense]|uniref:Uncharacterized protein n=1 Tax=Mesorhizobium hawassense TaxID=1209954 RepID=A0A330H8S8_9HYPH|nr:hypothetical protein DPM33_30410 [Mesorhizobium hawassense]